MAGIARRVGPWLLGVWAFFSGLAVAGNGVTELNKADFLVSSAKTPPESGAAWASVSLPDVWMERRPAVARTAPATGWYRMGFQVPSGSALQAVYLPRLGLNAQVFLNGVSIGSGGPFEEPVGRNWNRPLLFVLPPGLLRDDGEINRLDVRLLSHPYTQAVLEPVQVGPESVLRSRYEQALFWHISLNQTATLAIASMGVLMLTLWWQRRRDVAYAWFGLSSLIWACQSANLYLGQAPLPTATWEILVNASFQVFSAFLLAALLRFAGAGGRPLLPWLWGSAVVSPLALGLAPGAWFMQVSTLMHGLTLFLAIAVLLLLFRAAVGWRNREAGVLLVAMGLVVLFGAHDLLKHSLIGLFPEDVHLLHYSAPLIFLMVGLVMTSRFVQVLNQMEGMNYDLEARVAAKQAELRESDKRMHALETERAITEERERIYRDLHDDVGAKLLSLVYRADTPENTALARSALQDLRDVVSIIQPGNLTLEALSADWRAECERRLADAGIALEWEARGDLDGHALSQPQALNLGRILREAVSNLIKHAGTHRARIRIVLDSGELRLEIRDFGIGRPAQPTSGNGRGLRSMAMRAERIGAAFGQHFETPGGCEIRISLPREKIGRAPT